MIGLGRFAMAAAMTLLCACDIDVPPLMQDRGGEGPGGAGSSSASTGGASDGGSPTGAGGSGGAPTTYAEEVLFDEPLAYYRLGDLDSIAVDSSGHGLDGDFIGSMDRGVSGALAVDDDGAVELQGMDGAPAFVELSYPDFDFGGDTAFTFEAWLKPNTVDACTLFSHWSNDLGYQLSLTAEGDVAMRRDGDAPRACGVVIEAGVWQHLAVVFDGEINCFLGGELPTSSQALDTVGVSAGPAQIGCLWGCFEGSMDEVAIYDKPLPAARVHAHFAKGMGI